MTGVRGVTGRGGGFRVVTAAMVAVVVTVAGCSAADDRGSPSGSDIASGSATASTTASTSASTSASAGGSTAASTTTSSISTESSTGGATPTFPGSSGPTSASGLSLPATTLPTPTVVTSEASSTPVPSSAAVPSLPGCRPADLPTKVAGRLTIAAATDVGAPWFLGDPASGKGFDVAVITAAASRLGFPTVSWTGVGPVPTQAVAKADAAIGTFRVPDGGDSGALAFTTGYFPVGPVVLVGAGGAVPADLAAVKALAVGAVSGSDTFPQAATLGAASFRPYPTSAAALTALQSGEVKALVVDAVTAAGAGAGGGAVQAGRLSSGQGIPPQLGIVTAGRNRMTGCLSAAIDALRVEGTLTRLTVAAFGATAVRTLK